MYNTMLQQQNFRKMLRELLVQARIEYSKSIFKFFSKLRGPPSDSHFLLIFVYDLYFQNGKIEINPF